MNTFWFNIRNVTANIIKLLNSQQGASSIPAFMADSITANAK